MSTKLTHKQARSVIVGAFRRVFNRMPSLTEAQFAQAVGFLETRYGTAWLGAGVGSNNWGAIQSGKPPCDPGHSFEYTDSSPQPDGTSKRYSICFRKYPTHEEGAADLIRVMYARRSRVLAAATAGDSYGVSAAMYDSTYYQGFGRTRDERIARHHRAILRILIAIASALEEQLPDGTEPPPPTIQRGSGETEAVKDWQRIIGVVADGNFGPITERTTKSWQGAYGLTQDGIVGPLTWAKARELEALNA